jgi:hypothetical protein
MALRRTHQSRLALILAAGVLAGCAPTAPAPTARTLPPAPEFMAEAPVREPRLGERREVVAARERAGRLANASRLTQSRDWYEGVRKTYGGKK